MHTQSDKNMLNLPYLVLSATTAALLFLLLVVYRLRYYPSAPIANILGLLILNEMLQIFFELPAYLQASPNVICLTSVAGSTFFRIATNYWLIFITSLIYRQKAAPGKQIDLNRHISKNLIITYLPSLILATLILVSSNLDDTQSERSCWRVIKDKEAMDYVTYIAAFLLPNLVAVAVLIGLMIAYFKVAAGRHSIFILFPLVGIPFMLFYLVLKANTFLIQFQFPEATELLFLIEPFTHATIFLNVLRRINKRKSSTNPSDLTIKQQTNADSYVLSNS